MNQHESWQAFKVLLLCFAKRMDVRGRKRLLVEVCESFADPKTKIVRCRP